MQRGFHSLFDFVTKFRKVELAPLRVPDVRGLDIHWVVPPFGKGAGGLTTILRFVRGLELLGHKCTLWVNVLGLHNEPDGVNYKALIEDHYFHIEAEVKRLPDDIAGISGDVLIATDRYTCYPVRAMAAFARRFYFVQDQEEMFYPVGTEYFVTEATYRFGFDCLCAGKWLEHNMRDRFGNWAMSWDLSVDKGIYYPADQRPGGVPKIACYSRFVTPRRCVELMLLAMDLLARRGLSFEVDYFGWELPRLDVQYAYIDHGVVSERRLAEIYRTATIGVVFSATNYSLLPKEMMACGLPVVELNTRSIGMEFDDGVIMKADPDPESIADKIESLLSSDSLRKQYSEAGVRHVASDAWEASVRKVNEAIVARLSGDA